MGDCGLWWDLVEVKIVVSFVLRVPILPERNMSAALDSQNQFLPDLLLTVYTCNFSKELQSHSGLMTPTPTPHSPRPDFDPLSDPILTWIWPNSDLLGRFWARIGSNSGRDRVRKGVKIGSGWVGFGGWGSSGRRGSVAPSLSVRATRTIQWSFFQSRIFWEATQQTTIWQCGLWWPSLCGPGQMYCTCVERCQWGRTNSHSFLSSHRNLSCQVELRFRSPNSAIHLCSPCAPAEARRWIFFIFSQGNFGNFSGTFGGNFPRIFSDPQNKGSKILGKVSEHFS